MSQQGRAAKEGTQEEAHRVPDLISEAPPPPPVSVIEPAPESRGLTIQIREI